MGEEWWGDWKLCICHQLHWELHFPFDPTINWTAACDAERSI